MVLLVAEKSPIKLLFNQRDNICLSIQNIENMKCIKACQYSMFYVLEFNIINDLGHHLKIDHL